MSIDSHELQESTADEQLVAYARDTARTTTERADAFGELVDRYEARLTRYGRKFLSNPADLEDLVQDAFIKAYQNLQSFDASQRFSPWMYRIAHNIFVNALRKKSRAPFFSIDFDSLVSHPAAPEQTDTDAERAEMKRVVEQGLERLPQHARELLVLYYVEELSYKEIADVLKVPTGTVGVRLKRAKDGLLKVYASLNISYEF